MSTRFRNPLKGHYRVSSDVMHAHFTSAMAKTSRNPVIKNDMFSLNRWQRSETKKKITKQGP